MVLAAYAIRWHWGVVGKRQVNRCCAETGQSQAAIHYANLSMDACKAENFGPFDLARAFRVADRQEEAAQHTEAAREVGEDIESDQDRAWLFKNLM
jgi:hypothetical protein